MKRLISIDPGLDATGVALFEPARLTMPGMVANESAKLSVLIHTGLIKTSPDWTMPARCGLIWSELRHLCLEYEVTIAHVEKPAIAGTYAERGKRSRGEAGQMVAGSMLGFHLACGAIYAGLAAAGVRVVEEKAKKLEKKMKREYVNRWLSVSGRKETKNQDIADALFVGLSATWGDAA